MLLPDLHDWLEYYRPVLNAQDLRRIERVAQSLLGEDMLSSHGIGCAAGCAVGLAHFDIARAQDCILSALRQGAPQQLLAWAAAWVDLTAPHADFAAQADGLLRESVPPQNGKISERLADLLDLRARSYLAARAGNSQKSSRCMARAARLADTINARHWDEAAGCYADRAIGDGTLYAAPGWAQGMALYAQVAPPARHGSLTAAAQAWDAAIPCEGALVSYFAARGMKDSGLRNKGEAMRASLLCRIDDQAHLSGALAGMVLLLVMDWGK